MFAYFWQIKYFFANFLTGEKINDPAASCGVLGYQRTQQAAGNGPVEIQIQDRSIRLIPYRLDQYLVREALQRLLPAHALAGGVFRGGMPAPRAQWEYACRAGTETALYSGNLDILGERNAPALDPIAWYGGNSGVDFDLKDGYDSSDWKEK